jgi:hypothetical protein
VRHVGSGLGHRASSIKNFNWLPLTPSGRLSGPSSSSSIAIAADDEHLICGGFSLGKTVHLGNFEFTCQVLRLPEPLPQEGRLGFPMVMHISLSLYKFHKRPSATIWLVTSDHTLPPRGY